MDTLAQTPTASTRTGDPTFARQLMVAVLVTLPVSLVAFAFWQSYFECDGGLACLGNGFFAVGFSMFVAPLVIWLALRLVEVPRAFLISVVTVVAAHTLAQAVSNVQGTRHPDSSSWDVPMAPLWVYLGVGALSALVAVGVAGRGDWGLFARTGGVLLVILVFIAADARLSYVEAEQRKAEIAAVTVTPYLPDLGEHSEPSYASASMPDLSSAKEPRVEISYRYEDPETGTWDFPRVALVRTTANGPCADADTAGYHTHLDGSICLPTRDGFVADDGYYHHVGVVRGETTLMATFDKDVFNDEVVAEALRSAPRSSAEELARL